MLSLGSNNYPPHGENQDHNVTPGGAPTPHGAEGGSAAWTTCPSRALLPPRPWHGERAGMPALPGSGRWRGKPRSHPLPPELRVTAESPLGPLGTFLLLPAGTPSSQLFPAEAGGLQPGLIQSIRGVMSYESADSIKGDCDGRQSPAADGERSPLPSERVHLCRRVPSLCSLKEPERHKSGRFPAGHRRCARVWRSWQSWGGGN